MNREMTIAVPSSSDALGCFSSICIIEHKFYALCRIGARTTLSGSIDLSCDNHNAS